MKAFNLGRKVACSPHLTDSLPAISLSSNSGLLLAIMNDIGKDNEFAQQVHGYRWMAGALIGLSTSGTSENVLMAFREAKKHGIPRIGLTGPHTLEFDKLCDVVISAYGWNTPQIQEQHIKIYHALCARLEREFFK